jgi:predicted ATP-grasp superfamily ATP-dependent carboligase
VLVIVTDGDQRAALAAVRSLGRAGYQVAVAGSDPFPAAASRWSSRTILLPAVRKDAAAFAAGLRRAAAEHHAAAIIPMTEPSCLAVLDAWNDFATIPVPIAEPAVFRRAADKALALAAAREVGIAVPAQVVIERPSELDIPAIDFPVVVKPARSVAAVAGGSIGHPVIHVATPSDLRPALAGVPAAVYPLLVQERIVGPGAGIFVLLWEGVLVAAFAHRRIREKPPAGGVSVVAESIPLDPSLLNDSLSLLRQLGWRSGVAMVEYKYRADTGTPVLMEINPRFWGSLQLAIDCGVDFPRLLADLAVGRKVPPAPSSYPVGRRSRWWWGDVDRLSTLLRRSRTELGLPPDAPPRWREVLDFLRPGDFGLRGNVFRWSDPRPWLAETRAWFAALGRSRAAAAGS